MLVLIDADKLQREKWTIQKATTAVIDVSTRHYFQNAREGQLLRPPEQTPEPLADWHTPSGFALSVIASRNTAKNLVELAIPYDRESGTPKPIVASMDPDLISLVQPVVPPGFGFAVVDRDGGVLFHSKDRLRAPADAAARVLPGTVGVRVHAGEDARWWAVPPLPIDWNRLECDPSAMRTGKTVVSWHACRAMWRASCSVGNSANRVPPQVHPR